MASDNDNARFALDARRAAESLCMSKAAFHRAVSAGLLPRGFKVSGKRLWSAARLAELVEAMQAAAENERGLR